MKKIFNAAFVLEIMKGVTVPFSTYLKKELGIYFLKQYSDKKVSGRRIKFYCIYLPNGINPRKINILKYHFNRITEYAKRWYGEHITTEIIERKRPGHVTTSLVINIAN